MVNPTSPPKPAPAALGPPEHAVPEVSLASSIINATQILKGSESKSWEDVVRAQIEGEIADVHGRELVIDVGAVRFRIHHLKGIQSGLVKRKMGDRMLITTIPKLITLPTLSPIYISAALETWYTGTYTLTKTFIFNHSFIIAGFDEFHFLSSTVYSNPIAFHIRMLAYAYILEDKGLRLAALRELEGIVKQEGNEDLWGRFEWEVERIVNAWLMVEGKGDGEERWEKVVRLTEFVDGITGGMASGGWGYGGE